MHKPIFQKLENIKIIFETLLNRKQKLENLIKINTFFHCNSICTLYIALTQVLDFNEVPDPNAKALDSKIQKIMLKLIIMKNNRSLSIVQIRNF